MSSRYRANDVDIHDSVPEICQINVILFGAFFSQLGVLLIILGKGWPIAWANAGILCCYGLWLALIVLACWCLWSRWNPLATALRRFEHHLYFELWLLSFLLSAITSWCVLKIGANPIFRWFPADFNNTQFILISMIITAVLAGVFLRFLMLQHRWQIQQQLISRTELRALQSRLRPHFLYNSLNTIAALIEEKPEAAVTAIEDLSDLLRYSLKPRERLIPLSQELTIARQYLELQQWRMGERMQVRWDLPESWQLESEIDRYSIPPMALLALLENAIVHGFSRISSAEQMLVQASIRKNTLHLVVDNPVPVATATSKNTGNGTALLDLHKRLELIFDKSAYLTTEEKSGRFIAKLVLPETSSKIA